VYRLASFMKVTVGSSALCEQCLAFSAQYCMSALLQFVAICYTNLID